MFEKLDSLKVWIVAFFGALSAFLGWKGVLILILFILAVVDFATGWANAIKRGTWKSKTARDGIAHKVAMFVVVVVSGMIDLCLAVACAAMPDLHFSYPAIMLPLVLAWYIITEFGSILENAALLGAPVPAWLLKALEVGKKLVDKVADENISKESE